MSSNIIKKGTADGVRCAVTELRLSETFMDVPQLSVKVVSPMPIIFEIGDYITYDYNGVTYTLRSIPEAAKNARSSTYGEAFVYNLVFYSPMWDLRNAPFLDLVLYDNGQHFTSMPDVTTYEDVYGIAARVQANMDNMYPGKWEIRVVSGLSADSMLAKRLSETQDFSLSDGKCLDALSQVYSQWGVSFVYSYESGKHVITIGGAETQEDTTGLFMYGRGNGLKVIKSSVQNASEIATRYYVYGGTQNMQPRYYNDRTMEPEYIHASDASNSTITGICSGRKLLGNNMYVPNLMIPVSKWGKSTWYVWTASSHSQEVFTEVRNPSAGDDFAFGEPNIGASRNVIASVSSDSIVVGGITYQYLTEVLYPDIRKAYIDAPQSYIDKYGIRPATLRFDGSGERDDIHPSIKDLTIGDIRAGLGSEADYYPSISVYADPDERVDKVDSAVNPIDNGLTSNGNLKYDSILPASIEGFTENIEMKLIEREENDPIYGDYIYRFYAAAVSSVMLLKDAFSVVTERDTVYIDFPLTATVSMPTSWSMEADITVFKRKGQEDREIVLKYTKYIRESGTKTISFAPPAEHIRNYNVGVGMTLSIDVMLSYMRGSYIEDENVLPSLDIAIPDFTYQWKFPVSLSSRFNITIPQIGFDISDIPTNDGENPIISMTSGLCGGYEFEILNVNYNAVKDNWTLECARVQDSTLGQWFPNNIFKIEPEDSFVLLNIALPEVYITANEQRLYDAALAERLYEERTLLEPEIDNKVMSESPQVLRAGMWFSVKDTDLGLTGTDDSSYLILIDSVEVTDKPDTIRSFKVTLRNNKEDNVFARMQKQIAENTSVMQTSRRNQTRMSVGDTPTKGGENIIDTSDFVTLSTEQVIKGKKTFNGDAVFGGDDAKLFLPSTAGAGLYYAYFDATSAVPGETPTASGAGGLDVDELWEELGGSSTDKRVSKDHLPTDVVYTETLSDYYTKTAADARFVTLATEQTISGKKTFSGDVVFGSGGGRMFVPSTAGAGLYYMYFDSTSAVPGETPTASGGGLDVDELWTELGGSSSNKVIASSHIPDLYVKNTGDTMTGLLSINYDGGYVSFRATDNPYVHLSSGEYYGYLQLTASGILSMDFGHATGKGVYLNQAGAVGIGTTSPAYKLDVYGTARIQNRLTLQTARGMWINGKSGAPIMTSGDSTIDGMTYCPVIWGRTTAGDVWNLGHGATDQVGFFGFYSERTDNGTDWYTYIKVSTGNFYTSKNLYASGDIVAYSSSSIKLKDIVPHGSYSRRLAALGRVIDFRYNNILERDKNIHTGLIYEQVKSVMPSMCYEHEGYGALNYLCKDYINLIAGAAQEHTDELIRLKRKVRRLSGEVAKLRRALS